MRRCWLYTSELQLIIGDLMADEATLQVELQAAVEKAESAAPATATPPPGKPRPHGRRNLVASKLPRILVEICHEELDVLGSRWAAMSVCRLTMRASSFGNSFRKQGFRKPKRRRSRNQRDP